MTYCGSGLLLVSGMFLHGHVINVDHIKILNIQHINTLEDVIYTGLLKGVIRAKCLAIVLTTSNTTKTKVDLGFTKKLNLTKTSSVQVINY